MRIGTEIWHATRARVSVHLWKVPNVKWSCGYEFNEILMQMYVNCMLNALGEIADIFTIYRCVDAIVKMQVYISMIIHFFHYICLHVCERLSIPFTVYEYVWIFHIAFE